jgi:DDE superfamily endonuclease
VSLGGQPVRAPHRLRGSGEHSCYSPKPEVRPRGSRRLSARSPRGHDNVKAWLAKHPRFHFHFTPTSSSWLNLVERWFRELAQKALRRGVFRSVPELVSAIYAYLDAHNADPKPFVWTASAEEILQKVHRGRVVLRQTAS